MELGETLGNVTTAIGKGYLSAKEAEEEIINQLRAITPDNWNFIYDTPQPGMNPQLDSAKKLLGIGGAALDTWGDWVVAPLAETAYGPMLRGEQPWLTEDEKRTLMTGPFPGPSLIGKVLWRNVSQEIPEAVQNAQQKGFLEAIRDQKEQWNSNPEPFPGTKGIIELGIDPSNIFGLGEFKAGISGAAKIGRKGWPVAKEVIEHAGPHAANVLEETGKVGKKFLREADHFFEDGVNRIKHGDIDTEKLKDVFKSKMEEGLEKAETSIENGVEGLRDRAGDFIEDGVSKLIQKNWKMDNLKNSIGSVIRGAEDQAQSFVEESGDNLRVIAEEAKEGLKNAGRQLQKSVPSVVRQTKERFNPTNQSNAPRGSNYDEWLNTIDELLDKGGKVQDILTSPPFQQAWEEIQKKIQEAQPKNGDAQEVRIRSGYISDGWGEGG
jgi:ElaB/YqjD/DUF883 family membrane-anchored ribosome-binding protein